MEAASGPPGFDMTRFIFITGGVVSSLGKGITSACLGAILEARGLKVRLMKLDADERIVDLELLPAEEAVIAEGTSNGVDDHLISGPELAGIRSRQRKLHSMGFDGHATYSTTSMRPSL